MRSRCRDLRRSKAVSSGALSVSGPAYRMLPERLPPQLVLQTCRRPRK